MLWKCREKGPAKEPLDQRKVSGVAILVLVCLLSMGTKCTFLGVSCYLQGAYKQLNVISGKTWINKALKLMEAMHK